MLKIDT